MSYDTTKETSLGQLKALAQRAHAEATALGTRISTLEGSVVKTVKVNGTALTLTENGVDILIGCEKQIVAETGYAATYVLKANGVAVGDKINLPKDWLLTAVTKGTVTASDKAEGGKFENDEGFAVGDRYIDMEFNVKAGGAETSTHIYLNVQEFIDLYTAGNGLQENNGEFSVKIDSSLQNGLKVDANGLGIGLAAGATTEYVAATGTYVSGTTYYTDNTGATEVDTTGFEDGVTDVSSYFVAQAVLAKNGAMSGADKGKLDKIADQATRTLVPTEGNGKVMVNGIERIVVAIATDAEVTEMLNEIYGEPEEQNAGE